jgi:CBS domain containing-hemolysin-like protein
VSDPTTGPAGLVTAGALVVLAGVFSAADAALSTYSRARADELVDEGRAGAKRLVALLDDRARYVNTAILLRLLCETGAAVLVTLVVLRWYDGSRWPTILTSVGVMLVVSFVVVGVAPRTTGRQHADRVAPVAAAILTVATRVLGPIPQLLILVGNAITPGRGFRSGPFSTETELRELLDYAEASA